MNPPNRFEAIRVEMDPEDGSAETRIGTQFFDDPSRSILAFNDSPDVGFEVSINPYRGCEHGCVYCYARPFHEFLGWSAGTDFETKILVKREAPELLRRELASKKWRPQVIALSGVTDPYQPVERKLKVTRSCLQVLAEFRNPVAIVTKNFLVARDIDLLSRLAECEAAAVNVSITTLNGSLQRKMEPRASEPTRRLEAIRQLSQAGIPVRVLAAPVIPGLTDFEIPSILKEAAQAGAVAAGFIILRLPFAVQSLFEDWLDRCAPERKNRILNRIREVRGGKLTDSGFHSRMRGSGVYADQIRILFESSCRKYNLRKRIQLSNEHFQVPGANRQMRLFQP